MTRHELQEMRERAEAAERERDALQRDADTHRTRMARVIDAERGRDEARADNERLREDNARYIRAFKHTHTKDHEREDDACAECGLDIRDPIHRRVGDDD